MSTPAYVRRRLNVSFQLGEGSFGGGGFNTVTLKGLRINAQVQFAVLPNPAHAVIQVYGMTLSQMNQLSVAGLQFRQRNNKVLLEAGDDESGMKEVFNGLILEAYPDFSNQPDTFFMVTASVGPGIQLKPADPVSFDGQVSVETALNKIGQNHGLSVDNSDVDVQLDSPYFMGSTMDQIQSAIRAADCQGYLDLAGKKIVIWPKKGGRKVGGSVISPDNGMISYPSFEQAQVRVRTLFDPELTSRGPGQKFEVKSELTAANGKFNLIQIDLNLSSEVPGGPWEMILTGYPDEASAGGSSSAPAAVPKGDVKIEDITITP